MSSTHFQGQVTQIPAAWANDVDKLVYAVFAAAQTLAEVKTLLGLNKLETGGIFNLTSGSAINGTPIGATQAAAGRFSSLKLTSAAGTGPEDVVTHGQLVPAIEAVTGGLGNMAAQNSDSVSISGGTLDGVDTGLNNPGRGKFSELVVPEPTDDSHAVNLGYFKEQLNLIPGVGTIASQDADSVSLTGGSIDGVTIGQNVPAEAAFISVTTSTLVGVNSKVTLDNSTSGSGGFSFFVEGQSFNNVDMGFSMKPNGRFSVVEGANKINFGGGRFQINANDDGATTLQVGGSVRATRFTTSQLTPTAEGHLTSKAYVDQIKGSIISLIGPAVDQRLTGLGTLSRQAADSVSVTGGTLDGVSIGSTVRASGAFTQVNTDVISGQTGMLNLAGVGGYAGSGLVLSAIGGARPNISVVPNANGAFAVMAGGQSVFRTHANGRSVIGSGGDDGQNTLQVYGDAVVNGRLTMNGGTMTGSVVPAFGASAPTLARATPYWVRVRVMTPGGLKECVMPAFEVA